MLSQSRMIPGQTPLDYYQQVEMAVFQGVRDYPHEIGDAEGLIRRTFKAGLPERLQRQLSLHTFSSARAMAERVQCAWNDWTGLRMSLPLATQVSRHCGGQASQPCLTSLVFYLYLPTYYTSLTAESVPGLDFYSDNLFLFRLLRQLRQVPQAIPTTLTMRGVSRVLLGNDNFRQCALRSGAPIIGPRHFLPAEETFHVSPQVVSPKGRPTIQVRVNSKVLTAFVDTAPVHVVQTEFIEPKSGQFVSAAVARGLPESRAILVEGTNPKFIVPRSISAVQGRRTSVWVVNPDAKQRKLTQGTCIGFAEQVGAEQLVDVSAEGNVTGKEPRVKEDTVTHPSSTGHAGRDFSPEAAEFSQPKFTDATTQVHSLAEIDADELAPRSCKVWPADEQVAECPSDTSDDDIELCINVVESSDSPSKQVDLGHLDSVQQEELGKVLNKFPRLFSGDKATIDEALAVNENHSVNSDTPVNLATLASAVLREYQLKEDLWKEIIEFLEGKKLPRRALPASLHEFELDDGVLYHLKSLPIELSGRCVFLIHCSRKPYILLMTILLQLTLVLYVHTTICKIATSFQTCSGYANGTCSTVQLVSTGKVHVNVPRCSVVHHPVAHWSLCPQISWISELPWVAIDMFCQVDHHSRYLQLVPLRNKTAETVLRGFYDHFITLFGPPRQIMTDNGGEFANEQWQEVCRQLEIRCSFTIAYHPSSNGLVERTNRVVKDALAMLVADKPGRWPLYLTSVRGLTNQVTTDTNLRVQQLAKARQLAIAASLRSREANAQAHNRKVRSTWQPEEGALVLRRDFTGGALQDRWQGPCRVIKQIGPVVFEVKDLQPLIV
ncbi:hypothetical protein C7M84_023540 [Penaeus vannamei]|uniref:Integrase catalytic domain-containing protein n=1 Tax=Penaeus vannamei TaxID=6689 RepID=A0A3R7QLZ2_PENVA|nr:hypothetical protein C7M84_023540 [Penaeus vannamei]